METIRKELAFMKKKERDLNRKMRINYFAREKEDDKKEINRLFKEREKIDDEINYLTKNILLLYRINAEFMRPTKI